MWQYRLRKKIPLIFRDWYWLRYSFKEIYKALHAKDSKMDAAFSRRPRTLNNPNNVSTFNECCLPSSTWNIIWFLLRDVRLCVRFNQSSRLFVKYIKPIAFCAHDVDKPRERWEIRKKHWCVSLDKRLPFCRQAQ